MLKEINNLNFVFINYISIIKNTTENSFFTFC